MRRRCLDILLGRGGSLFEGLSARPMAVFISEVVLFIVIIEYMNEQSSFVIQPVLFRSIGDLIIMTLEDKL